MQLFVESLPMNYDDGRTMIEVFGTKISEVFGMTILEVKKQFFEGA